ncbi:MAG: hypothetical protein ABSG00_08975 [Terracidiphilus sp.]
MSSIPRMPLMLSLSFLCGVAIFTAAASAQSSSSTGKYSSSLFMAGESSSNEFHLEADGGAAGSAAMQAASADGQSSGASGAGYGRRHKFINGFALELGGGFNAPIGNDTSTTEGGPFITWGGNLTAGGGVHFSPRFSLLGEFQFLDNKLPGAFIAEAGAGASNGNTHIVSLTAAPVIDLFPKHTMSAYLTGGGGYYHKSTNFSIQVCCDYYGYPVNINTNSFSSNQLGGNLGVGFTRRLGGTYGDGTMKLFGEARYLYLNTPRIGSVNGLGRTELIPVTIGVRW